MYVECAWGMLVFNDTVAETPSFNGRIKTVPVSSLFIGLACSYGMEVEMADNF